MIARVRNRRKKGTRKKGTRKKGTKDEKRTKKGDRSIFLVAGMLRVIKSVPFYANNKITSSLLFSVVTLTSYVKALAEERQDIDITILNKLNDTNVLVAKLVHISEKWKSELQETVELYRSKTIDINGPSSIGEKWGQRIIVSNIRVNCSLTRFVSPDP